MKIIFSNPKISNKKYKKELINSFSDTLNKGKYINSTNVSSFQNNFSRFIGTNYCLGLANATDAIYLALKMLDIKEKDEVITPSHTAAGTVIAILNTGAKPVFVDINESSFNIDIKDVVKKITNKTKVVIAVHLYGQSCNMLELNKITNKKKINLIEDCSQSAGAKFKNKLVGSFGEFGCFSFFPTKNLSCIGDGGAITFNKKKYLKKLTAFREYGWDTNRNLQYIGINSRLDEIQAGFLNIKLKNLNKDNILRRKIANLYLKKIKNKKIILPEEEENNYHVYHLFVIRVLKRNNFIKYMKKFNIHCGIHYSKPIHMQKLFKNSLKVIKLNKTDKICNEIVSLPIYPDLSKKELNYIIDCINVY